MEVPVTVFLVPAIGLGMGLFWLVAGQRMLAGTDRRHRDFRLGTLAQRLGLHIIEGDPSLNMVQAVTRHNMRRADTPVGGRLRQALGDSAKETRVLLQGAPYGRPTAFSFHSYTEHAERVVVGITTRMFDCRLSLQVPVDLPPFEIVRRPTFGNRYRGLRARAHWDLPAQSFGDPALDRKLALTSTEPRIGAYLAPIVAGLASQRFVHIQGRPGLIESLMTEEAYMYAVFELQTTQHILEHMAAALAGPVQPR